MALNGTQFQSAHLRSSSSVATKTVAPLTNPSSFASCPKNSVVILPPKTPAYLMREAFRGHQGSSGVISRHLAAEDCRVRLVDNGLVATAHVHRRIRRAKRCRRLARRMHEGWVVPDERLIASGLHAVREKAPYRRQSEAIRGPSEGHQRAIRGPSEAHERGPEGRLVLDSAQVK